MIILFKWIAVKQFFCLGAMVPGWGGGGGGGGLGGGLSFWGGGGGGGGVVFGAGSKFFVG